MAFNRKDAQDRYLVREHFSARAARLTITLAGRRARLGVLLLAMLFSFWQLYVFGWVPLSRETMLPAGLAGVTAELDVGTLAKIRDARVVRLQHQPNLFSTADQYFTP